jgi:predicted phosphoribosyltransferase
VAQTIDAELDLVVARKIGAPGNQELGLGAVTVSGPVFWHHELLQQLVLTEDDLTEQVRAERAEAGRRLHRYRGDRTLPPLDQRTVLVVDDGLATGATAVAALREVRLLRPRKLILAVPVCARAAVDLLSGEADELWCLHCPEPFIAVGVWYSEFPQMTDDQVEQILASAGAVDVS